MSDHLPTIDNPLESATSQMRILFGSRESLPAVLGPGSLGRMLIHISNISHSVIASTQDHVNAAKRLNDFALIFTRVAASPEVTDETLSARLTAVSDHLRAASEQLSRADAVPAWRAVEQAGA